MANEINNTFKWQNGQENMLTSYLSIDQLIWVRQKPLIIDGRYNWA